jgi:hypothetical protein
MGVNDMKAKLARFIWALTIIASMALTLGAGIRWGAAFEGLWS